MTSVKNVMFIYAGMKAIKNMQDQIKKEFH